MPEQGECAAAPEEYSVILQIDKCNGEWGGVQNGPEFPFDI
jgi:hypothetical protein